MITPRPLIWAVFLTFGCSIAVGAFMLTYRAGMWLLGRGR